jgi:hypothetical protein
MIAQLNSSYIKTRPLKVYNRVMSYALFEGRPLTTSGRWINPLVFSLLSASKLSPIKKKVEKPIFILGIGRSGTTLLGTLMSMHRSVGFLNEPKAIWHSIYPKEDLIGSYTDQEAHYKLGEDSVTDKMIHEAHQIYGTYLMIVGAKRVVDKYPELVFRTDFVRKIFPDARFVFLARNGWNTCSSIDNWSRVNGVRQNEETHDWWGKDNRKWQLLLKQIVSDDPELGPQIDAISSISDQPNMAAVEWMLTMEEGLRLTQTDPNSLMVRYEELTQNPVAELKRICEFCDLTHDEKLFNYSKKVVKPVPDKEHFDLNGCITGKFYRVMDELGY